jgi:hypothetical protein
VVLLGGDDPTVVQPMGDSTLTLNMAVNPTGVLTDPYVASVAASSLMADGGAPSTTWVTNVCVGGRYPLYLTETLGTADNAIVAYGWLYFSTNASGMVDVTGANVAWLCETNGKPNVGNIYPHGWTNATSAVGSYYQGVAATKVSDVFPKCKYLWAVFGFVNGVDAWAEEIQLVDGANGAIPQTPRHSVATQYVTALSINPLTGIVTGTFTLDAGTTTDTFTGLIVPSESEAAGWIIDNTPGTPPTPNTSGEFLLIPVFE